MKLLREMMQRFIMLRFVATSYIKKNYWLLIFTCYGIKKLQSASIGTNQVWDMDPLAGGNMSESGEDQMLRILSDPDLRT
jgi:hypothetical protein